MLKILPLQNSKQDRPARFRPLVACLALICTAVGAVVVVSVTSLALIPLLLGAGFIGAWLLAALLLGWAGVEGLAALERWFEGDSRFQR